jgi:hypothetical protein
LDCVPQDVEINTVVSVPQSVAHAPDVAPRLVRHQLRCSFTQPKSGLANAFKAPFDGVTPKHIGSKGLTV